MKVGGLLAPGGQGRWEESLVSRRPSTEHGRLVAAQSEEGGEGGNAADPGRDPERGIAHPPARDRDRRSANHAVDDSDHARGREVRLPPARPQGHVGEHPAGVVVPGEHEEVSLVPGEIEVVVANPVDRAAVEDVLDRDLREARDALSLTVWERAPWSVKCSVVSAVSSACRSGSVSATAATVVTRPDA